MFGLKRVTGLLILTAILAVIVLVKFLYRHPLAVEDVRPLTEDVIRLNSPPDTSLGKRRPPTVAVPSALPSALTALTESEAVRILFEDQQTEALLNRPTLGRPTSTKRLSEESTVETYDVVNGTYARMFTNGVVDQEDYTWTSGESATLSFEGESNLYAITVRKKNYSWTNFYDQNRRVVQKVESVNADMYCVRYDERREPLSREPGICPEVPRDRAGQVR
jgi:hypothetical protein